MNSASRPEQSSQTARFITPPIGNESLATDLSDSAQTTMPHVNFDSSRPKYAESFDDGLALQDHDTQAILKNQTASSCKSSAETIPSKASSQVVVVRYPQSEPNTNQVSNSDHHRVAAERTLIVCVEGTPCWDEIVALIHNTLDCSGVTLVPIDMGTMQFNAATDTDDRLAQVATKTTSPKPTSLSRATISNNLTPRENEIMQLYQSGISTKTMAEALGISIETLRTHRKNIYSKLSCRSIVQAIAKMAVANLAAPTKF